MGKKVFFQTTDKISVGGAYSEMKPVKTDKEKEMMDKMKNFSIKKNPESKDNKISQEKLNKFINLKL